MGTRMVRFSDSHTTPLSVLLGSAFLVLFRFSFALERETDE
jgi:hypothetical protein